MVVQHFVQRSKERSSVHSNRNLKWFGKKLSSERKLSFEAGSEMVAVISINPNVKVYCEDKFVGISEESFKNFKRGIESE